MITIRCTQKLLTRLKINPSALKSVELAENTSQLGDWYANLLLIQRQQIVVCVNEKSRLCLFTPAKDIQYLPHRLQEALGRLLNELEFPADAVNRECVAMQSFQYGTTSAGAQWRSVLGSMNDYLRCFEHGDITERSLEEWNLYFSKWLSGPLNYGYPKDEARKLLCSDDEKPSESRSTVLRLVSDKRP